MPLWWENIQWGLPRPGLSVFMAIWTFQRIPDVQEGPKDPKERNHDFFSASVAPESICLHPIAIHPGFSLSFLHSVSRIWIVSVIISRSLVFFVVCSAEKIFLCWISTYADLQESLFQRSWEVCFIISRSQKPLFEFRNHFENAFELLPKCSVFHVACAWLKSKHVKFRTKWKPVQPAFQYLAEDLGRYILSQGLNLKAIETLCKHGAFAPEVSRRHKVGSKPAIQMLEHISWFRHEDVYWEFSSWKKARRSFARSQSCGWEVTCTQSIPKFVAGCEGSIWYTTLLWGYLRIAFLDDVRSCEPFPYFLTVACVKSKRRVATACCTMWILFDSCMREEQAESSYRVLYNVNTFWQLHA